MKPIFTIEPMEKLPDCFRSPLPSTWFSPVDGVIRNWPSFHASNADPDGMYKLHEYGVSFTVSEPKDCELYIKIYVSTPRMPFLSINLNGFLGHWYPNPSPSTDKVIRPAHALHASIYSMDETVIHIPSSILLPGKNQMVLTALDEEPIQKVTNEQAVLRLDRMADACGFHYSALSLSFAQSNRPKKVSSMRPKVVYLNTDIGLQEECELVYTPFDRLVDGKLDLSWETGSLSLPLKPSGRVFGEERRMFLLPDGKGEVQYRVSGPLDERGGFFRRRKWLVYTTPHAHTDVGYTHRQSEVAERMSRNLDTALKQLQGPSREAFSYILDSSWALLDYAYTRGEEGIEKVLSEAKRGKIGIPSNFVDLLTHFASLEELIENGVYSDCLMRPYQLRADRMDIVDVASATSSLPSVLMGMGVKYLLHANNQDRGPFRLNSGLHRKSPFYWQGPDGQRLLTWLSRMYCEFKKVCGSPGSIPAAKRGLDLWLKEYERDDYHPDAVILYGQEADNTDLDIRMADFAKDYSGKIAYPKLIPSNGSSFFEYINKWSDTFPVVSGDQGAYWEDGAASSPLSSFKARRAQAALKAAQTLDSLASLHEGGVAWPRKQYDEAWRWLLLYDEHTWGSFLSGPAKDSLLQQSSWAFKANMAHQALLMAESLLTRAATRLSLKWNNEGRELVVHNPNSFDLSGIVNTEFNPDETMIDSQAQVLPWEITGQTGSLINAKVLIPKVPALSYSRFKLVTRAAKGHDGETTAMPCAALLTLENQFYRIKIKTADAKIVSMMDKDLNLEVCGKGLGGLLRTKGSKTSTLLGNHARLTQEDPEEIEGIKVKETRAWTSALGDTLVLSGECGFGKIDVRFFLPKAEKRVDLSYHLDFKVMDSPEALYIDFDTSLPENTKVLSDNQTTWVNWATDTMRGACLEWLPLQTSMLLKSSAGDIQIVSPQAFLFTVNQPVKGLWTSDMKVDGNRVLSYVFNNHWQTNYHPGEDGMLDFSYAITSDAYISPEDAYRFGWAQRQGLVVQRMSYQEFRDDQPHPFDKPSGGTLFEVDSDHIVLNTLLGSRHTKKAFVARLTECSGKEGVVHVRHEGLISWQEVDHLEYSVGARELCKDGRLSIKLLPWQVKSVMLFVK